MTASLENCKRLYELSGWGYRYHYPTDGVHDLTDKQWYWFEGKTTGSYWEAIKTDFDDRDPYDGRRPTATTHRMGLLAPAYTSDYLLEKLPPVITLKSRAGRRWSAQCFRGRMAADGNGVEKIDVSFTADTPADALTLLSIELFEKGVLTK